VHLLSVLENRLLVIWEELILISVKLTLFLLVFLLVIVIFKHTTEHSWLLIVVFVNLKRL